MNNLLTFKTFQEFLTHNQRHIQDNYFTYYHFIRVLNTLESGKLELFDAYNVIDDDGNFIICLWVTGNYFVYSDKWTDKMIETLIEKVNVERFKNFTFLGQRDLVIQLFEKNNVEYEVFKDRLIYECKCIAPSLIPKVGKTENATYYDFDELVQMSMDNYIEEYDGKGKKTIDDMKIAVSHGIEKSSLFLLRDNGIICSIVQVINDTEDEPMIGNLFTKKAMRNKGYGYSLLHTVTEGLLNGYEKCGLISDIKNPASNKVFINIGYKVIYKWIDVFKEKHL